jgi:hypothetical protein
MNESFRAEVGRALPRPPSSVQASFDGEIAQCEATCDAFVPRRPILTVAWDNAAAGTGAEPTAAAAESSKRLDISGTATGFEQGSFYTVPLSRIPVIRDVALDPVGTAAPTPSQALLSPVKDDRVVERAPDLPVFESPDAMTRGMTRLQPELQAALEADRLTGALSQVRVVGRGSTPIAGKSHQVVTLAGLQPGATYRLRLVDEQNAGARTVFNRICRIPVCPADFLDPRQ